MTFSTFKGGGLDQGWEISQLFFLNEPFPMMFDANLAIFSYLWLSLAISIRPYQAISLRSYPQLQKNFDSKPLQDWYIYSIEMSVHMSKETFLFAISLPNKVWTNNLWDKEPCSYFSGIYINPSIILNFFWKCIHPQLWLILM